MLSSIPSRRSFLGVLAAGAAAPMSAMPTAGKRPNIILILADDMGFSDPGCFGSEIETPHLDSLARGGIRFTQFYNNARCCPSRSSLLTGLYNHETGIGLMTADEHVAGYRGELNNQCVTLAEALQPAGYHRLMCGKWHVAHDGPQDLTDKHDWPLQRGFEHYFGTIAGACSYYNPYSLTLDNDPIGPDRKEFYYTGAITRHAAGFISEYASKPD
ncbi:MAG: sulfatase-like hydrolase/transferase, partial [Pseudomonadota bacterium]